MQGNQQINSPSPLDVIGNTPIIQLRKIVPKGSADIFVKLEYFNSTGSYKDHMALAMIEEAEKRGDLRPGMTAVEYTGGSTGSALAFVCASQGVPLQGRFIGRLCDGETPDNESIWCEPAYCAQ